MGIISIQKYANGLGRNSYLCACPYMIPVFKQPVFYVKLFRWSPSSPKNENFHLITHVIQWYLSGNEIFWASPCINRFNGAIKVKTNLALDSLIIKMQLSQLINCEVFLLLIVLKWLGFFTGTFCGEQGPSKVSIVREWKGGLALKTVFVYGNLAFMNGWLTI